MKIYKLESDGKVNTNLYIYIYNGLYYCQYFDILVSINIFLTF